MLRYTDAQDGVKNVKSILQTMLRHTSKPGDPEDINLASYIDGDAPDLLAQNMCIDSEFTVQYKVEIILVKAEKVETVLLDSANPEHAQDICKTGLWFYWDHTGWKAERMVKLASGDDMPCIFDFGRLHDAMQAEHIDPLFVFAALYRSLSYRQLQKKVSRGVKKIVGLHGSQRAVLQILRGLYGEGNEPRFSHFNREADRIFSHENKDVHCRMSNGGVLSTKFQRQAYMSGIVQGMGTMDEKAMEDVNNYCLGQDQYLSHVRLDHAYLRNPVGWNTQNNIIGGVLDRPGFVPVLQMSIIPVPLQQDYRDKYCGVFCSMRVMPSEDIDKEDDGEEDTLSARLQHKLTFQAHVLEKQDKQEKQEKPVNCHLSGKAHKPLTKETEYYEGEYDEGKYYEGEHDEGKYYEGEHEEGEHSDLMIMSIYDQVFNGKDVHKAVHQAFSRYLQVHLLGACSDGQGCDGKGTCDSDSKGNCGKNFYGMDPKNNVVGLPSDENGSVASDTGPAFSGSDGQEYSDKIQGFLVKGVDKVHLQKLLFSEWFRIMSIQFAPDRLQLDATWLKKRLRAKVDSLIEKIGKGLIDKAEQILLIQRVNEVREDVLDDILNQLYVPGIYQAIRRAGAAAKKCIYNLSEHSLTQPGLTELEECIKLYRGFCHETHEKLMNNEQDFEIQKIQFEVGISTGEQSKLHRWYYAQFGLLKEYGDDRKNGTWELPEILTEIDENTGRGGILACMRCIKYEKKDIVTILRLMQTIVNNDTELIGLLGGQSFKMTDNDIEILSNVKSPKYASKKEDEDGDEDGDEDEDEDEDEDGDEDNEEYEDGYRPQEESVPNNETREEKLERLQQKLQQLETEKSNRHNNFKLLMYRQLKHLIIYLTKRVALHKFCYTLYTETTPEGLFKAHLDENWPHINALFNRIHNLEQDDLETTFLKSLNERDDGHKRMAEVIKGLLDKLKQNLKDRDAQNEANKKIKADNDRKFVELRQKMEYAQKTLKANIMRYAMNKRQKIVQRAVLDYLLRLKEVFYNPNMLGMYRKNPSLIKKPDENNAGVIEDYVDKITKTVRVSSFMQEYTKALKTSQSNNDDDRYEYISTLWRIMNDPESLENESRQLIRKLNSRIYPNSQTTHADQEYNIGTYASYTSVRSLHHSHANLQAILSCIVSEAGKIMGQTKPGSNTPTDVHVQYALKNGEHKEMDIYSIQLQIYTTSLALEPVIVNFDFVLIHDMRKYTLGYAVHKAPADQMMSMKDVEAKALRMANMHVSTFQKCMNDCLKMHIHAYKNSYTNSSTSIEVVLPPNGYVWESDSLNPPDILKVLGTEKPDGQSLVGKIMDVVQNNSAKNKQYMPFMKFIGDMTRRAFFWSDCIFANNASSSGYRMYGFKNESFTFADWKELCTQLKHAMFKKYGRLVFSKNIFHDLSDRLGTYRADERVILPDQKKKLCMMIYDCCNEDGKYWKNWVLQNYGANSAGAMEKIFSRMPSMVSSDFTMSLLEKFTSFGNMQDSLHCMERMCRRLNGVYSFGYDRVTDTLCVYDNNKLEYEYEKQLLDLDMTEFFSFITRYISAEVDCHSLLLHKWFLAGQFYNFFGFDPKYDQVFEVLMTQQAFKKGSEHPLSEDELSVMTEFTSRQFRKMTLQGTPGGLGKEESDALSKMLGFDVIRDAMQERSNHISTQCETASMPLRSTICSCTNAGRNVETSLNDKTSHERTQLSATTEQLLTPKLQAVKHLSSTEQLPAMEIPSLQKAFRGGFPTPYIYSTARNSNNPWAKIVVLEHSMAECAASKCSRKLVAKHEADIAVEIINIFKLVHEDGKLNNGKGGALYKQADKCMKVMAERCMGVSHATNMHAMVYDIMYKYHRVSEIVENQIMADLTLSD